MRVSKENIQSLAENEVFVFGSNLAGRHGKGAAKTALKFGALHGSGWGLYGQTFAIPTKDANLKVLSLDAIGFYVTLFLRITQRFPDKKFLVTQIGCGLSNYTPAEIASLFRDAIDLQNVYLPQAFLNILNKQI